MALKYFYNKILAPVLCQLPVLVLVLSVMACGKSKDSTLPGDKTVSSVKTDTITKTVTDVNVLSLPIGNKPKDLKDVKTYDDVLADSLLKKELPLSRLPDIKSVAYVIADKNYGLGLCYEKPVNIKLLNYKYRLPDYNGFQIYYMTGDAERTGELKTEFGIDCLSSYGNLIVYNPKIQKATVLTAYYSFYIDSQQQRYFYIDKNYTIYLADASYSEGKAGADFNAGGAYKVIITDEGNFEISKIREP